MSDQSEESHVAGRMKLILNYSIRDQLISCLNLMSTMLESNKSIPEDAKSRVCKKIEESIGLLAKLLPFESTPSADDSATFEEQIAAELTIELPSDEQTEMIKHLALNRNALLFYDQTTDEAKRSLISENERMVIQLMKLSHKKPSDLEEDESIIEPPSKRQRGR